MEVGLAACSGTGKALCFHRFRHYSPLLPSHAEHKLEQPAIFRFQGQAASLQRFGGVTLRRILVFLVSISAAER